YLTSAPAGFMLVVDEQSSEDSGEAGQEEAGPVGAPPRGGARHRHLPVRGRPRAGDRRVRVAPPGRRRGGAAPAAGGGGPDRCRPQGRGGLVVSEQTFAMVKPDLFRRPDAERALGRILTEIVRLNPFRIEAAKHCRLECGFLDNLYEEHRGRPFYEDM